MSRSTRRHFMQTSAAAGAGLWVAGGLQTKADTSANGKIQFACIGVDGKGSSDSADAGKHGEVVAICDIDEQKLDKAAEKFPNAKKFFDFRELIDQMGDRIDAVTVSTPDHTHAVAAGMAMMKGKHCFCQKPLTHSIWEARRLGEIAREKKVKTQMGNQGTSEAGVRKAAALIQGGLLGDVKEVHVWTNRPIWPQGIGRPEPSEVPAHVKWELWLGPAAYRPYAHDTYHPFKWRGWWDFGTGALGDMACHTVNMPFMALDLRNPTSVEAETSGHNNETYPSWSIIKFEFPANDKRGPVTLHWYDGKKRPDAALLEGIKQPASGALLIGSKGKLFSPDDYGATFKLIGDIKADGDVEFTKSPGHFTEWVEAIKGGPEARSNFPDYSGPLTETILLGNLAVFAKKKVEWDAKNLKAANCPEVDHIIHPQFREGYTL